MSEVTNPIEASDRLRSLTLYWQVAIERVSKDAIKRISTKQNQLERLKKVPFEKLTRKQVQRMNYLEEEINAFVALLDVTNQVVEVHVLETGAVADLLRNTWAAARWYQQQLLLVAPSSANHQSQ